MHVTYGYDALGRRAWRKSEAGTTSYLWHNDVLLGEQNPEGQWQWYIRDPNTDEPLLTLIEGQPHFYELDWRMMPIRLWDVGGELVWQAHADAWGSCQPEMPKSYVHQPIRLPGQFEDEFTGIVQNRFREYCPQLGRYCSPDPLGIRASANSFFYTHNPLDYLDPLGLAYESAIRSSNAGSPEGVVISDQAESLQEVSPAGINPFSVIGEEFPKWWKEEISAPFDKSIAEPFNDFVRDVRSFRWRGAIVGITFGFSYTAPIGVNGGWSMSHVAGTDGRTLGTNNLDFGVGTPGFEIYFRGLVGVNNTIDDLKGHALNFSAASGGRSASSSVPLAEENGQFDPRSTIVEGGVSTSRGGASATWSYGLEANEDRWY